MPSTIRLHRVLTTSPEKVYRAFLEADAVAKWLPPNGFACTVHHQEPKVGGTFKMSFRNFTNSKSHSFGGQYAEKSIGRHRSEHRTGWRAGRDSARGLLSRLAGVAAQLGESRRPRDPSI